MINSIVKSITVISIATPVCYLLLLALIAVYKKRTHTRKKDGRLYTSPPFIPNISMLDTIKVVFLGPDPASKMIQWAKEFGTIYRINSPSVLLPNTSKMIVATNDIRIIRTVLKENSVRRTKSYNAFRFVNGGGENIFSSDGAFWKHSRKAIAPAFSSTHLDRMKEVVVEKCENFVQDKLMICIQKNDSFDVADEMLKLTLSIISWAAFQYQISDEEIKMVKEDIPIALRESMKSMLIPIRKKLSWMLSSRRRALLASERIQAFGHKILNNYRNLKDPLKGTLIDLVAHNESYKNDNERVADIFITLLAGHDTTAYSLAWTILELAKNEKIQIELRKELLSLPVEERIKSIKLQCVIKEGIRKNYIAPLAAVRITSKDLYIPDEVNCKEGIFIPKGTAIYCNPNIAFHNEKYHKEPETFNPSRWINPSKDAADSFIPFTLGRRNCVGQALARLELDYVVAMLCSRFHFSIDDEGTRDHFITLRPVGAKLFCKKID